VSARTVDHASLLAARGDDPDPIQKMGDSTDVRAPAHPVLLAPGSLGSPNEEEIVAGTIEYIDQKANSARPA
jgi:hypothetical protein